MNANRDIFKGVNSIKFYSRFTTDADCYKYLADIKWPDGNFVCKRCGNVHYGKGKLPHSRRCTRCGHDESPTAGTMFDKLRLSLLIAFHIAFKISTKKKGMSSTELSEEYEIRQKTCWEFKWKIQQAMKSSHNYPLTGIVHVDEFYIGGEEEALFGRNPKSKKRLVVVALEILEDSKESNVGRAYAEIIKDASAKSFRSFFASYIDKNAKIITDEWNGYKPLIREGYNIEQRKSENGKAFPQMHIHIMNVKGWLRGIHHHCSRERLQGYLDEYHFRYNRRNNTETIFDVLIRRMANNKPIRLKSNS